MDKIKERLREPTTYLGISALIMGIGQLFKINEAPEIAQAVQGAAEPLAGGDYVTGGGLLISGILAVFMREKGNK